MNRRQNRAYAYRAFRPGVRGQYALVTAPRWVR